jgi:hypothetical protein
MKAAALTVLATLYTALLAGQLCHARRTFHRRGAARAAAGPRWWSRRARRADPAGRLDLLDRRPRPRETGDIAPLAEGGPVARFVRLGEPPAC